MEKSSELKQMEELDARVDKINYDLIGLESRKKDMEDKKLENQKAIDDLEKEKCTILGKTDQMNRLQKLIYIIVALRTDLKRVELINTKISEHHKEKESLQNKIDIQNKLYVETMKEKEKYIEQRKELYTSKTMIKDNSQVSDKTSQIKALVQIYEMTTRFKDSKIMKNLNQLIEQEMKQYLNLNEAKKEKSIQQEEQDEME